MDRNDVDWKGYWPSCSTPFRGPHESLDIENLRDLLEYYVGCGFHGTLINGTVGEWFSQTESERKLVAETAVDQVAGRMTVVVGCTAYTAKEVIGYARHAFDAGADGVEVSAPPYSKPTPDEIIQYYEDISAAIDGPMMVYNWPHGTNVEITPDIADRLVDIENVVSMKDSTPNADQFFETSRRIVGRARVFGPYVSLRGLDEMRTHGGDGFIGGGSLWGRRDADYFESLWKGDFEYCEEHARRTEALFPKLWQPGGYAGLHAAYQSELKVIMSMLGQPSGTVRRPRLPLTDSHAIEEIRGALIGAGLLSV